MVDVAVLIATGARAAPMPQARESEEETKRLVALGREGALVALIDNIEHPLGSDVLAAALTGTTFKGRVLGASTMCEVAVPVLVGTGNNVTFQGDLGRRVVPIDLQPEVERPEERSGFRYPDLRGYVRDNRARLVVAALTVLRWHAAQGRPAAAVPAFGSFEAWSTVVRHPVVLLGEPDPCEGRSRVAEAGDPELEARRVALAAWSAAFGDRPVLAADLLGGGAAPELRAAMAALDRRPGDFDAVRLGYVLRRIKGRIVGGLRLEMVPGRTMFGARWRVVQAPSGGGGAEPATGGVRG